MSAINQITLSIPQVKEILAEKLENDINKTIHKLFPNLEITISGDSINEILCNDQPLDGLFSQDSRFIKNDYVCKDIPIFGIGSLTLVNYPQLVGFLANPYDNSDPSKSIFHDLNIVSLLAFGDDESTI
jgi:hypothetical protein